MPELPEVETTIRGLTGYLHNRRIERIEVRREGLRRPFPPELVQTLTGARIIDLTRRAKYGVLHTDRDVAMVFHLGMSGRWRIEPDALEKHDHLVLHTQAEGPCPPPCWRSTMRGGLARWIWWPARRWICGLPLPPWGLSLWAMG
jgi:formamidopyrimidine-DNA glycosylase